MLFVHMHEKSELDFGRKYAGIEKPQANDLRFSCF